MGRAEIFHGSGEAVFRGQVGPKEISKELGTSRNDSLHSVGFTAAQLV
jgi:hypothetical protein